MLVNLIAYTYVTWQDSVKLIKIGVAFCSILYVLYDIFAGAYSYIPGECLFGITAVYSLLMSKKNSKKLENKTEEPLENIEIEVEKENFSN